MELPLRTVILHSSSSLQQRFHTHKPTPELPSPFSLFVANPLRLPCSTFASKDQQHYFPVNAPDTRAVLNPISKGFSCTGASCGDSSCDDDDDGMGFLDNYEMIFRDCDKLIESFMLHETDWRKFIILNKKWSNIRPHFFRHCRDKADAVDNPVLKNKLLWLGKKLKEIDEELQRHNELILMIKENPSEISEIVSRSRRDFTREFFMHLHTLAESSVNNLETQNDFAKLRNMCLAAVKDYDCAMESIETLNAAELNFQDIIKSPSDASCWKIDNLAI